MKFNLKKLTSWEYWPSYMFYIPVVPYACLLALKAKSFGFFSAVNPAIEGAGNGLESKFKTIQLVPPPYRPKSILFEKGSNIQTFLEKINNQHINYPFIIKPDIGFRGLLVKKINSEKDLITYVSKYNAVQIIIQEFIEFPNECGIFYHRIPGEKEGKITSITLKKYLSVIGNGTSTLKDLILQDDRAQLYLPLISELNKERLHQIPSKNEKVVLNIIGNHSKGTQFINGNHLISQKLTSFLDQLNAQIDGWYYGRIDLKYTNFEELIHGKNFKIIEINGIISEPTHIYDASKGTYFKALKSIKNHWKLIYKIGVINHQIYHVPYTNFTYLKNIYFNYKKYLRNISILSKIKE